MLFVISRLLLNTCFYLSFARCISVRSNYSARFSFLIPNGCCKHSLSSNSRDNPTLSGIQPSGDLHIGNYVGCLDPCVKYQDSNDDLLIMTADLHAFSGHKKFSESHVRHVVALLIASGIDTSKSTILLQSHFPEILELQWILSSLISPERLCKLSQFDNRSMDVKNKNIATMLYPLLMASDILLFKANCIIAGPDQIIHVNLTRKIAKMLNNAVGSNLFPSPELLSFTAFGIKSLSNGNNKMSKSDGCIMNRINMLDSDDVIHRKVKAAKTETIIEKAEHSPEVMNLLNIYSFFSNKAPEQILEEEKLSQLSKMKDRITEVIIDRLKPIRTKYFEIVEDEDYISDILRLGRERLQSHTSSTLRELKHLLGHFDAKCL